MLLLIADVLAWAKTVQPTEPVCVIINGVYHNSGAYKGQGAYVIGSSIGNSYPSGQVEGMNQILPTDPYNIGSQNFPLSMTITGGYIQLTTSTSNTDVTVNSNNFTLTFTSSSKYIIAASVTKNDGTAVSGCTVTGSYSKSVSVHIPQHAVFGKINLTMTVHAPIEVCTISGIASSYVDDGVNQPEPTVILEGQTLTKDVHYTASYGVSVENGIGYGTVTVTGIGEYTGSKSQNYNIRLATLSDFKQLGDGAYEIATPQDMINLARFVNSNQSGHMCEGVTFRQTADISYSYNVDWDNVGEDNNFTPISCYGRSFRGTYDGDGHTVSGIRVYNTSSGDASKSLGLFGYVGTGGTVKNIILNDARIIGAEDIGGLVGYLDDGACIMDCYIFHTLAGIYKLKAMAYVIAGHTGNDATITRTHYRDCKIYNNETYNNFMDRTNIYTVTAGNGVVLPTRTGGTVLGTSGITTFDDGVIINGTEYYCEGATVTVSPVSGYRFTNVSVTNNVNATDNGNGTWSFVMPYADLTVSATLAKVVTMQVGRLQNVSGSRRMWATFYHPDVNFKLPGGVMAYTMKSDGTLYRVGDGSVVPAGCAVVLMMDLSNFYISQLDINITPTDESATPEPDNILLGSATELENPYSMPNTSQNVYVLGRSGEEYMGFYKYKTNKIPANKAYFIK